MDLDQAMLLERSGDGYTVRYAIADVAAVVPAGGAVQQEAWLRGQTVYCPDERISLYPPAIGEGAASLLPDQERPALVYVIELDGHGRQTAARVDRAIVRSHRRLAYGEAEVPLLEQIGTLRLALARERGSITLNAPAQTVVPDPTQNCGYRIELEHRTPDEDWNAEISLLAGMAAAGIMVSRGLGLLRTMGGADPYRVKQLQTAARGLGVDWPEGRPFAEFVTSLDPALPQQAALIEEARDAMGHAGYAFFEGTPPEGSEHAGIAARYAHTTAPLRRLADRYVLDLVAGGGDREALAKLPEVMSEARLTRRAGGAGDRGRRRDAGARAPRWRSVHRGRARKRPPWHRDPDRRPAGAGAHARRSGPGTGRHRCRAADAGRPGLALARVPPGPRLTRLTTPPG